MYASLASRSAELLGNIVVLVSGAQGLLLPLCTYTEQHLCVPI